MTHPKKLARLFALLITWLVVTFYVIWGLVKNLSLLTIAWSIFLLALIVYVAVFYYSLWIVVQGTFAQEGKMSHDESRKDQ